MKINSDIIIVGSKVILTPYLKKHVNKYHIWMQNPELQELTASEPLTLEEEFKMQQSWLDDDDKCTFIILDKNRFSESNEEIESMIGDVNLFFTDKENPNVAEIEIMIAEAPYRSKGCGKEALLLMLHYGEEFLSVSKYIAKIKEINCISIKLFEKIGFKEVNRSAFFKEITFELPVTVNWTTALKSTLTFAIKDLRDLNTEN